MDRNRLLQLIERQNPDFARALRDVQRSNPRASDLVWRRLEPQLRDVLVETDPSTQKLRLDDLRVGWDILLSHRRLGEAMLRGAPPSEIEAETSSLRSLLGQRFELQTALQQRDVARLERRLADLKAESEKMKEGRERFVAERLEALTKSAKDRASRDQELDARHDDPDHPGRRDKRGGERGPDRGGERGAGKTDGPR
jgi:hypothetical protein